MRIALDGVACLGKTSALQIVEKEFNKSVSFVDYHDYLKIIGQETPSGTKRSGLITALAYTVFNLLGQRGGEYVDRSPVSSILYQIVFMPEEERDEALADAFDIFTCANLLRDIQIVCLLPAPGTEKHVVELMRKRGNGIDVLTEEYVRAQTFVFRKFVEHFQLSYFEIDVSGDFECQIRKLIESIM